MKHLAQNKRTLVFSIALNGYQYLYQSFLQSHRRYAERHGYQYLAVTKPKYTATGVECCWLKLFVLQRALQQDFDAVLFLDADAYVCNNAPAIESVVQPNKFLYMVKGYSGRFNSGMIYALNQPQVRDWVAKILAAQYCQVPSQQQTGWGENGHIIHFSQNCDFLQELPTRWNNTFQANLPDYIRHYSFGPLRSKNPKHWMHKCLNRLTLLLRRSKKLLNQFTPHSQPNEFSLLTASVEKHYREQLQPDQ